MLPLRFAKMHGLGNDFLLINALDEPFSWSRACIARFADRHCGVGFDQLLLIEPKHCAEVDFTYRIFNADGSEVEHCGNGARCFAKYIYDNNLFDKKKTMRVAVKKGIVTIAYVDTRDGEDYFQVQMVEPDFGFFTTEQSSALAEVVQIEGRRFEMGIVSMGNPHAVIAVENLNQAPLEMVGHALQHHALFPQGVNVGFVQYNSSNAIDLRVFERGVGETQACGTGACAAVAVGRAQGLLDGCVKVDLLGGSLEIEWQGQGAPLYMTGPAVYVYDGVIRSAP